MVASPFAATVVTAILRCDFCAAKFTTCTVFSMSGFFGDLNIPTPLVLCFWTSSFSQGRAHHEVQTGNWNTGIFEAESANSLFVLDGLAHPEFTICAPFLPLIHGFCAFFRVLLTPLSTAPSPATLSVHGLHFTICLEEDKCATINVQNDLVFSFYSLKKP